MEWAGVRVLDLFAGSGALAFECLSRGAAEAWLVDNSPEALACIAKNAASLGVSEQCRLVRRDAVRFLASTPQPFNAVFIDPPYRRDLAQPALALLNRNGWLAPGCHVAAEIEAEATVTGGDGMRPMADRLFGQTRLLLWEKI